VTTPPGFVIDAAALKRGESVFRSECRFVAGANAPDSLPPDNNMPEIAFAGRSNVGKSSLINALTGRKALARASHTPGRTQQINFFELAAGLRLVDLPGYGYAKASKARIEEWNSLVRGYLRGRRSLKRACVLIDARHGIRAADQDTMETLSHSGVPYVVVLTKADKTPAAALEELKARIERELAATPGAYPAAYVTSSSSKAGIPELRAVLTQA
jgi:GTP-binding protein